AWSPDRSFVIVSSNAGDINHRHLWRVNVAGGRPEQITEGPSIEMNQVIINGGKHIAFLHSTSAYPLLPYFAPINGKGAKMLAPQALPTGVPSGGMIEPEQVTFKASDGMLIHGQLFKPRGATG